MREQVLFCDTNIGDFRKFVIYFKVCCMTINQCIEAMINLEVEAMVWELINCPIDELNELYVPNGKETHVILTSPDNEHIVNRLRWTDDANEIPPEPTILKFHNDYYCYIIYSDDEEEIEAYKYKGVNDDLPF